VAGILKNIGKSVRKAFEIASKAFSRAGLYPIRISHPDVFLHIL
jgi:hypothetical protein